MGTEILRSQDCLFERIRAPLSSVYHRRCYLGNCNSYYYNSSYRTNRKSAVRSEKTEQRKRFASSQSELSTSRRSSSEDLDHVKRTEKVTVLRRGELFNSKIKSETLRTENDGRLIDCGTERLCQDPDMIKSQIRYDLKALVAGKRYVYAGSAFAVSPAPSSLPLPSFSNTKQVSKIVNESATKDLRRLLRLDA